MRGIGNRPGAAQMNSGYHWPYGRREGVLPIWAHRRASAPGAMQFPRIIFQHRPEGYASRTCEDSTRDAYFCLSFSGTTRKDGPRRRSPARAPFNSDKGRIMSAESRRLRRADDGRRPDGRQPRSTLTSLYPPRRDFVTCADASTVDSCMGGSSSCQDHPDSALYAEQGARRDARHRRGHDGDAARRHRADASCSRSRRRGPTANTSRTSRSTPRATTTGFSTAPPTRRRSRATGTRGR